MSSWSHHYISPTLYLVGRARTTVAFVVGCNCSGGCGVEGLLPLGEEEGGSSLFLPFGSGGCRSALTFAFLIGDCV